MIPSRIYSGLGMLFSSAVWGKAIEIFTGITDIFGWIAITSVLAFIGGMVFTSGIKDEVKCCRERETPADIDIGNEVKCYCDREEEAA